jgi:hypothetical protein
MYQKPPYPKMSLVNYPSFSWEGPDAAPHIVVGFPSDDGPPRFVAMWPTASGFEAAIFDLDGEMTMPEIGRWTTAGGNLTSIGTLPAGQLRLGALVLNQD